MTMIVNFTVGLSREFRAGELVDSWWNEIFVAQEED